MKKTNARLMNRSERLRLLDAAGATAFVGWEDEKAMKFFRR